MAVKEFSHQEIQDYPDHSVIIIIDGKVYDVTEFVDIHPGGRQLLKKYHKKDATEAFKEVFHSLEAMRLLESYKVGVMEGYDANQEGSIEASVQSRWHNIKSKLITHEDRFHLHKLIALPALIHFFVRCFVLAAAAIAFVGFGYEHYSVHDWLFPAPFLILFAILHGLLSVSSLQFTVPRKSSQSKPMIHQLFRAHSICFALRAVFCMILAVVLVDQPLTMRFFISLVVLLSFVVADYISHALPDTGDNFKTTSSMPYWFGCSVTRQKIHKLYYAFSQFFASIVCLFGGYQEMFFTLLAIQGAALLMTLTRKSLITNYWYHQIYTALLFFPIPFYLMLYPLTTGGAILVAAALYFLRSLRVNKYVLWLPVLAGANLMALPEVYRQHGLAFLIMVLVVSVAINLWLVRKNRPEKIDPNNRLLENKRITHDSFELTIRTKTTMDLSPGQHVLIRFQDDFQRKYTPIKAESIAETNQTLLTLRIKEYKHPQRTTGSSLLAQSIPGSVFDLHGPLGAKYFCEHTQALVDGSHNKVYNIHEYDFCLFAAGSGITPIFQLAQEMCRQQKKIKLVTCDKDSKSLMMFEELRELKNKYKHLLSWQCFFSQGDSFVGGADRVAPKRMEPANLETILISSTSCVAVTCGPPAWERMIKETIQGALHSRVSLVQW